MKRIFSTLITKRISAGVIDFLFLLMFEKLLRLFSIDFNALVPVYYITSIYHKQSTMGGILLNIKTISLKNEKLGMWMTLVKSIFYTALLFVLGIMNIKYSAGLSYGILFGILAINFLPYFFTKSKSTIHDIITRSSVTHSEKGFFDKKDKVSLVFGLIFAVVFFIGIWGYVFFQVSSCIKLAQQKKSQLVIDKCQLVTKISNSGDLYFIMGTSYMTLGQYDKAQDHFVKAGILGKQEAQYTIVITHLLKKDYDKVINNAKLYPNDLTMIAMAATAYSAKYELSSKTDDLMNAYLYAQLFKINFSKITDKTIVNYQYLSQFDSQFKKSILSYENKLSLNQMKKINSQINAILNKKP